MRRHNVSKSYDEKQVKRGEVRSFIRQVCAAVEAAGCTAHKFVELADVRY